jgi:hypothetical protein
VAIIAIAVSQGGSDGEESASGAAPTTAETQETAASGEPANEEPAEPSEPVAEEPPAEDDPLSDGDWTLSDVQIERTEFGDGITARVTNNADESRTGIFTLTIFGADGSRIGESSGSVNDVEAGGTATVTFIGTTEALPGDPATYTYAFQDDGSF